ncbi:4'-phosphopantetheinyl transferase superfamily protein [Polynucleobacter paneuropaeus]|nr:4'-phosphopantetheinyl transferase superfamily protein [Polynucleobacter paneuropaeus]MBT8541006.1 4'-phosphopantetheinyl transferase superfamily protein [Polynucleobacter paneuropaeus]MBT8555575.1 4'-phosphopantetheinyl transferase superfamily protein [Polynucleobacter paneuropaeus]MBT8560851.1 4'-phosphopantetheinyl transferase superfamily protein [Polynucleobacter paneuropaeus]
MSTQITLDYLSRLLNKSITEGMEITLSSAQKSRLHGWLTKNDISFNEFALAGKFTIDQLLLGVMEGAKPQLSPQIGVLNLAQIGLSDFQIGIDIQRVEELFPQGLSSDPKADKELTQIFTARELSYAQSKPDPEITLTGIFCAKEAIQKTSTLTKNLNKIEVLPDVSGKPKSNGYELSISHSGNYAIAIAIKADSHEDLLSPDLEYLNISQKNNPRKKSSKSHYLFSNLNIRAIDILFIGLLLIVAFYK